MIPYKNHIYGIIFYLKCQEKKEKSHGQKGKDMDKTRQRLKKRRSEANRREKDDRDRRLADEFNDYYKKQGLRCFSRKQILAAYKQVERESAMSAMTALTVTTLRAAHKYLGYGARRLWRVATEITARIAWVGNNSRTIPQLDEELRLDAHIICSDFWNGDRHIPNDIGYEEYQRRDAVLRTVPYVLPIFIHAVFYTLFTNPISRQSIRLERITQNICDSVKYGIENDTISAYRSELRDIGFIISEQGRFGCAAIDRDEYDRGLKRINL